MASVLFAWELGDGYGHISTFLSLGAALRRHGHTLTLALPRPEQAAVFREFIGDDLIQAPALHLRGHRPVPPGSFAQMLEGHGFADPTILGRHTREWLHLLQRKDFHLLVANHAPGALLAARVAGMKQVYLGTGFSIPPVVHPSPRLLTMTPVDAQDLARSEQAVLACIAAVCREHGAPVPAGICELYGGGPALIYSVREMDPFAAARRDAVYIGPRYFAGVAQPARWPEGPGARVFGYLRSHTPGLDELLQALNNGPWRVLLHIPGLARSTITRFSSARMRFSEQPVDVRSLKGRCELVLGNASHGASLEALLQGCPLLMLPTDQEKLLYARCVQRAGMGVTALPQLRRPNWAALMRRALGEDCTRNARALAGRYASHSEDEGTRKALAVIEAELFR